MIAEIEKLIVRHSGKPHALHRVMFAARDTPTEPSAVMNEQASFAFVASGQKHVVLGDRTFTYGRGQYLVISAELPLVSNITRASKKQPFVGVGLKLDASAIASLLLEGTRDDGITQGIAVHQAGADLIDALARLLRLLDHPRDLPVLAPMAEREILWRLLTGEQGAMIRQIGLADSRLSQIARAIRAIRSRYAEPLRIDELVHIAGMSPSSFHRHFRAVTAMTPIQYQKQIRLQEARARLLGAGVGDVAAVGRIVGYDSASQFSREYRRLYGVAPMMHLSGISRSRREHHG
ncbi:MAG: AraC family transcriptional regulator [Kofleriaceae bacterium]